MRLSATERIIREAEEKDTGVASSRPLSRGEVTPPSTARDLFKLDEAQAAFEVDVDIDDDEGATLVDAERASAALREMRSYGTRAPPPPFSDVMGRSVNLSPNHGPAGVAPGPKTPAPVAPAGASPTPTLRWAGGVPPGRPVGPISPQAASGLGEAYRGPAPPLSPAAWVVPPPLFDIGRPRRTVGRRTGILIAAGTAAAVAMVVGAWTAGSELPTSADVRRESPLGKGDTPRVAVSAVIVPTVPEMPSAPSTSSLPQPPPVAAAPGLPSTGNLDSLDPASSAAVVPRPRHTSATTSKARPARKLSANKTRRSGPYSRNVGATRSRPKRAVEVASPPAAHAHDATRLNADPDATLPITD